MEDAERVFRKTGITFAVYGEQEASERLIPFDIVPRIIAGQEWRRLALGIEQRVQALNAFLDDIYHRQEILRAGRVPRQLIADNEAFLPEMIGVRPPAGVYTHIIGVDIVRISENEFYVLEDNARTPSGVSYMLENRETMMQLFPELFQQIKVRPVENNPALPPEVRNDQTAPSVNPYNYQEHLYDKSRPENLEFLTRIRALLDEYPGRTSVGEIGDSQHQLEVMAQYTSGTDKVHMAYTFYYLGGAFDAGHFRKSIDLTEKDAPNGWICLAFSNHDVVRHVSRWMSHGDRETFGRLTATMLLTMRGSVCLYQGEELGLTEAELAFEDLVDPYGIEFWPQFKGRDGCRTPMVWQSSAHLGGFSTAPRAWLPVPGDHLLKAPDLQEKQNDSLLHHYRATLKFRREHQALVKGTIKTLDAPEGVLMFTRTAGSETLLCAFNMTGGPIVVPLPDGLGVKGIDAPGSVAAPVGDGALDLPAFGGFVGAVL